MELQDEVLDDKFNTEFIESMLENEEIKEQVMIVILGGKCYKQDIEENKI